MFEPDAAALPVLVLAYGNPGRGDDALGPLLLEQITAPTAEVELLWTVQLQVEHTFDLAGRRLVLFVDAAVAGDGAFSFAEVLPGQDASHTSHAMSPGALLWVCGRIGQTPPPCFLLAINGRRFRLGAGLSAAAGRHLRQARRFAEHLLAEADYGRWRALSRAAEGRRP